MNGRCMKHMSLPAQCGPAPWNLIRWSPDCYHFWCYIKKNKTKKSLIIQNKLTSQFHFYVSFYMQACLVLTCVSLSLSACRRWRSCHVHHASCTRNTGLTTSSHYQLSIIKWMFCFVSYITLWLIPGVAVCCFIFLQLLDKTNCCLTETLSSLHLNSNKQDQTCIFAKTLQRRNLFNKRLSKMMLLSDHHHSWRAGSSATSQQPKSSLQLELYQKLKGAMTHEELCSFFFLCVIKWAETLPDNLCSCYYLKKIHKTYL